MEINASLGDYEHMQDMHDHRQDCPTPATMSRPTSGSAITAGSENSLCVNDAKPRALCTLPHVPVLNSTDNLCAFL